MIHRRGKGVTNDEYYCSKVLFFAAADVSDIAIVSVIIYFTAAHNAILHIVADYLLQTWRTEKRSNQQTTRAKMAVVLNIDKVF